MTTKDTKRLLFIEKTNNLFQQSKSKILLQDILAKSMNKKSLE